MSHLRLVRPPQPPEVYICQSRVLHLNGNLLSDVFHRAQLLKIPALDYVDDALTDLSYFPASQCKTQPHNNINEVYELDSLYLADYPDIIKLSELKNLSPCNIALSALAYKIWLQKVQSSSQPLAPVSYMFPGRAKK